ncbi:MAG: flavin reductase family protein, partial [Dehalococcoidales bacterium]
LPLPIALISTVGQDGTYNAAPFSFITPISLEPLLLCIAFGPRQGQKKDTVKNIEFSHDFVVNVVDEGIIERTVQASADYPGGVDEIKETGLTAIASEKVKSPRIAQAKVSLECRLVQKIDLVDGPSLRNVVIAEVVLVHIKDEVLVEGKVDPSRLRAVGNMGKDVYCRTGDIFEMKRP